MTKHDEKHEESLAEPDSDEQLRLLVIALDLLDRPTLTIELLRAFARRVREHEQRIASRERPTQPDLRTVPDR